MAAEFECLPPRWIPFADLTPLRVFGGKYCKVVTAFKLVKYEMMWVFCGWLLGFVDLPWGVVLGDGA